MGIYTIPMPVIIDGKSYFEDVSITQEEFFSKLHEEASVSTSQPSPEQVTEAWDSLLVAHDKVIYIPMSAGLSGSVQTAKALAEDYGERVHVVDNRRISVTLRQSVLEAKHLAEKECARMRSFVTLKVTDRTQQST